MQACEPASKGRMDGVRAEIAVVYGYPANFQSSPLIQEQNQKRLPNKGKPDESFSQDATVNRRAHNEARNIARGSGTGWFGLRVNAKLHLTRYDL